MSNLRDAATEIQDMAVQHCPDRQRVMLGCETLNAAITEVEAKLERTYCAYCGQVFELIDATMAMLQEHISVCPDHPMRAAEARADAAELENAQLRAAAAIYKPAKELADRCVKLRGEVEREKARANALEQRLVGLDAFIDRKCDQILRLEKRADAAEQREQLSRALDETTEREAALVEALRGLVVQVERSNAVDDHGYRLEHLRALHVARQVLNGER